MGKSLKKRYKNKAKSVVKTEIGRIKKGVNLSTGGMLGGKKEEGGGGFESAADQYAMKDVARSRAAGSGVFNYTDQEMKKV